MAAFVPAAAPTFLVSPRSALSPRCNPAPRAACLTRQPAVSAPAASAPVTTAQFSSGAEPEVEADAPLSKFAVGDAVRVSIPMSLFNVSGKVNQKVDVMGREGTVFKVVDHPLLTVSRRVIVRFPEGAKKFMAHFEDDELETVE